MSSSSAMLIYAQNERLISSSSFLCACQGLYVTYVQSGYFLFLFEVWLRSHMRISQTSQLACWKSEPMRFGLLPHHSSGTIARDSQTRCTVCWRTFSVFANHYLRLVQRTHGTSHCSWGRSAMRAFNLLLCSAPHSFGGEFIWLRYFILPPQKCLMLPM